MKRNILLVSLATASALLLAGCVNSGEPIAGSNEGLPSAVAEKAVNVASQIGGANGFGAGLMDGYTQHSESPMGFNSEEDLADPAGQMMVRMQNQSDQNCTFHLTYFASPMGLEDQGQDVEVPAGQEITVAVPCAELMGMGSLEDPGAVACHLANGHPVSNMMSVPGFLGMDYACGGTYSFVLKPDADDLDGDGDTTELLVKSEAMQTHMEAGGPMGHMHDGQGMMQ